MFELPAVNGWKLVFCRLSPPLNTTGLVVIVPTEPVELVTSMLIGPIPGRSDWLPAYAKLEFNLADVIRILLFAANVVVLMLEGVSITKPDAWRVTVAVFVVNPGALTLMFAKPLPTSA